MTRLDGHLALVTGGGGGLGLATVIALRTAGAKVVACGRRPRPEAVPQDVHYVRADVSRPQEVEAVFTQVYAEFGSVSILVNNAGVQIEKTVADTSDEDWDALIGVNCRGVFNMCRAFMRQVPEGGGRIVNVGSIAGEVSDPSMAIYCASKGFVQALTRSIAVDHGPLIRCNAVRPGWIMTAMAEDGFALSAAPDRARADAIARHPVGRLGRPEDIAAAIQWLVSDEASFTTGQCFTIDGGLTCASPIQPGLIT